MYMLYFPLGCKTKVVSQAVIMCRESRLSCIYLPNSVTLRCRTLWCHYCCGRASTGAMTITATSKSLSFPTTTFGASNTPSAKIWPWKQHLILLLGHLLNQLSGDWSGALSDDLCSKICLQKCSWHISIHRDAFRYFYWCSSWPVSLILWRIDCYIQQI